MERRLRTANLLMFFAFFLVLQGCKTTNKLLERDTVLDLNIIVANDINPTEDGRASPIILNVFSLENERQFEQEDFISLYQAPDQVLGRDLITMVKLKELTPGEVRTESFGKLDERTQFVGVMAEFIRYQDSITKIVLPIESHTRNSFTVFVDRLGLRFKEQ